MFASLTFALPPLAGFLSFMYRRTVWNRADYSADSQLYFQGLDRDGNSRPGIKDMILSCLHIRPVLTAWGVIAGGSKPCDWYLEKAFEGTFEGCPSALLQTYAWLCREQAGLGNSGGLLSLLVQSASILCSLKSMAEAVNIVALQLLPKGTVSLPHRGLGLAHLRRRIAHLGTGAVWHLLAASRCRHAHQQPVADVCHDGD